jgi:beta-glucosidase
MRNILGFAGFAVKQFFLASGCNSKRAAEKLFLLLAVSSFTPFIFAPFSFAAGEGVVYQNKKASLEERVNDLAARLTPEEKLHLLTGTGFTTQPVPRLGIPAMGMVDAGQGVRGGADSTQGPATAFPSGVAMAASWDTDLVKQIGKVIGEESHNKGTGAQVLLGPAVNIQRSPLGGRNGEYFTEDPYLAARLAVAYIQGVQGTGVSACIKHFACNNEEADRDWVDVQVGERALREIYLPAFEAGVKEGGVWSLMDSYNKINGPYASANAYMLTDVLKKGWGFDGLVMSDWGAVHEVTVAKDGNDLEMPGGQFETVDKLKKALQYNRLSQAAVDESVKRILRTIIRVGLLDNPAQPNAEMVNSKEHQALAKEAAERVIVLLKNEGKLLPLDRKQIRSIAVIGGPATDLQVGAEGSPAVTPFYKVQILDGIKKMAGEGIQVTYAAGEMNSPLAASAVTVPGSDEHGFKATYYRGTKMEGTPIVERVDKELQFDTRHSPWTGLPKTNFSTRWSADLKVPVTGNYTLAFTGDDGFRVMLDGKKIIERWTNGGATTLRASVDLEAGKSYKLVVEYYQDGGDAVAKLDWAPPKDLNAPFAEALAAAKAADVAIVCVSTSHTEGEGQDRPSMDLPNQQGELIQSVAAVNKSTVVVLNNGTPVTMKSWIKDVPAVVETWFPGQEGGAALAAILFGDVNPSGKLPTTFAADRGDYPDVNNFPGKNGHVKYEEGIYVGYRHFDKKAIEPVFPFGHGLSYTQFDYKNLKAAQPTLKPDGKAEVSVDVTNSGQRAGEEVVQLYVHDLKPQVDKPVRELKGFARVALQPGETKPVTFNITPRDLAYFDVAGKQWKADAGDYEIDVGTSSRDIRQKANVHLDGIFTEAVPLSQDKLQADRGQ